MGKALVLLQRIGFDVIQAEEQALTARALRGLKQIPGITVFGISDPNTPQFAHKGGVIVFRVEGLMAPRVAQALAKRGGIGVRSGCHCAHLLVKRLLNVSPALEQFQGVILTLFKQVSLPGLTRISLGIENNAEEIDTMLQVLRDIATQPHSASDAAVQRQMNDFACAAAQCVYTRAREAAPSIT